MSEAELTPVRDAHRFDEDALRTYMVDHVDGYGGEPLAIRQFEGGQSNPTFLVEAPGGEYVMRKQPPGELLPSAHQVDREYRVMDALGPTDVPVPKMHCLCEDASVIGTKFYLMEHVRGRLLTDNLMPDVPREQRRDIYLDVVRTSRDCIAWTRRPWALASSAAPATTSRARSTAGAGSTSLRRRRPSRR